MELCVRGAEELWDGIHGMWKKISGNENFC